MTVLILLATAVVFAMTTQHPSMPAGMTHDEHMRQLQKEEALKRRGAEAMGFDQDAAAHAFRVEADGGSIEVRVTDVGNAAVLGQVRAHLREIAGEFARGNFARPFRTHAEVPPGVPVLQQLAPAITYTYEDLPDGGAVRIRTADPRARDAVHEFLRYQIAEHRTGDRVPGAR